MVFGMLSWATYSVLLKKKKHELSQLDIIRGSDFIWFYFFNSYIFHRISNGVIE